MFGYVRTDTPYLYIKDDNLYRAMYCGVCKGISEVCGQSARMGLSYDVTFLSVILHNLAGLDVQIEKSHCLTHCIRSRQMANVDEMTRQLGALNTALVYYKYTDDIADGDKGRGKRLWFKKGFRRVKKAYPEIARIVRENMHAQEETEKTQTDSIDRAADATANMLAEFCDYALGKKTTEYSHNLFYTLGKWIYLIDALDDYDKDVKKGAYNPFVLAYGEKNRCALLYGKHAEDVRFVFHALFYDIRENLSHLHFHFNRDLVDNVLLRGLPMMTKRIMDGCGASGKCKSKDKTLKTEEN
ncbi:MAG: hypothetical protein E7371_00080 [Clostridiales bacterium]|nr:hypothetical protein [Clostridiales bacterium]